MGPLTPEVVQSTYWTYNSWSYPASSVLILGEEDTQLSNGEFNYWLADREKTTGEGFTMKVNDCPRVVAGFQIKNKGQGLDTGIATKDFRVSGSLNEDGPWETLLEEQLSDTKDKGSPPAPLLTFTFEEPVKVQFLKFDLISYWGPYGGGLQYFAPIPA